jgi:hypothetical protein
VASYPFSENPRLLQARYTGCFLVADCGNATEDDGRDPYIDSPRNAFTGFSRRRLIDGFAGRKEGTQLQGASSDATQVVDGKGLLV